MGGLHDFGDPLVEDSEFGDEPIVLASEDIEFLSLFGEIGVDDFVEIGFGQFVLFDFLLFVGVLRQHDKRVHFCV